MPGSSEYLTLPKQASRLSEHRDQLTIDRRDMFTHSRVRASPAQRRSIAPRHTKSHAWRERDFSAVEQALAVIFEHKFPDLSSEFNSR